MNILTGDRPTGSLHLGHYVGSLKSRLQLQESASKDQNTCKDKKSFSDAPSHTPQDSEADYHAEHTHKELGSAYIMVADTQALTDNFANKEKVREGVIEVVKDYLAVGLNPKYWNIFLQSKITELFELTSYLSNLTLLNQLRRVPTLKEEIAQKGLEGQLPMGFLSYPISQAADLLLFDSTHAPVGEDQIPLIEFTNDLARKYNNTYAVDRFVKVQPLVSSHAKLMGINGKQKASKSLNNAIYLKDTYEDIASKVKAMYTDPNHIKISDPGTVEGNVVFHYLDAFYTEKDKLEELKQHYTKGGLGDGEIKRMLVNCLEEFIAPIRERRNCITKNHVLEVLHIGSEAAKIQAMDKINLIRQDLGLQ